MRCDEHGSPALHRDNLVRNQELDVQNFEIDSIGYETRIQNLWTWGRGVDRSNGAVKPGRYKVVRDKPPRTARDKHKREPLFSSLSGERGRNMTRDEMQVREERHANQAKLRPGRPPGGLGLPPGST